MTIAEIEAAVALGAVRALSRHADALRVKAAGLSTSATDSTGRTVVITGPEAVIALETAQLFEQCAGDLRPRPGGAHAR